MVVTGLWVIFRYTTSVELDESDALYQKVLFSTVFVLFIIRIVGEVFDCCSGHEKAFWNYVDDKQSAKEIASRRKKQKIAQYMSKLIRKNKNSSIILQTYKKKRNTIQSISNIVGTSET